MNDEGATKSTLSHDHLVVFPQAVPLHRRVLAVLLRWVVTGRWR